MSYRPYYGLSGYEEVADTVYTLVLSQPATQGRGASGAWTAGWIRTARAIWWCQRPISPWTTIAPPSRMPAMPETGPICWIRWRWLWTEGGLEQPGSVPDAFVLEGASDLSELFDLPLWPGGVGERVGG